MNDFMLAWRNIWRQTRRSILTMMAIAFAAMLLVFMLSFQLGSYDEMINASVKLATGHLQVQAQGYHDNPKMRRVVENTPEVLAAIQRTPGVAAASPRSQSFVLAASGVRTRGVLVMGVDPQTEPGVSRLPALIRKGHYLDNTPDTVICGDLLAKRLKVDLGDELTLLGQGRDGSIAATVVTISGIFKSGIDAVDRATLQMPLSAFDSLFGMDGAVHTVVATAETLKGTDGVKAQLKGTPALKHLAVLDWTELNPGLKQSIQMDLVGGVIMYVILIIVVAFSILNTFLMAVFERTREFGVMLAIGTTPGRLVKVILTESMLMTLMGISAGMILGAAATLYFQNVGIPMGGAGELLAQFGISGKLHPKLSVLSVLAGPALIAVITSVTALIPALRIPRLKPVEAMQMANT